MIYSKFREYLIADNISSMIISSVKIYKQCLQTASAFGELCPLADWAFALNATGYSPMKISAASKWDLDSTMVSVDVQFAQGRGFESRWRKSDG